MGLFTESLALISSRRLETKAAVGSTVSTWHAGLAQFPGVSYERLARQGYGKNELVYACLEELCSSASEPRMAMYREGEPEPERIMHHQALDLFNRPNPWLSRYAFMAGIILYRYLAGNVYVEKVRSRSGQVVEFWLLRPDRMRVIPDPARYIAAYEYRIGNETFMLRPEDVIHIKTNHPLDDFYGMPPLAAAMERVDTDNLMRQFVASFFTNAGVPAGILNIKQQLEDEDRAAINERYRSSFGGGAGWHSLMVLDNVEAQYQPLGLSTGARGLAAPELDEINEARIPMVTGVPLELIGARLGMIHGNRSTMKEARASFWDETLSPLYAEIAEAFTLGMQGEYDGSEAFDYFEVDTSRVKALQEDEDKKHERLRADMLAGGISREEFREELGREPEMDQSHTLMLSSGVTPWPLNEPQADIDAEQAGADGMGGEDSPDFPELSAPVSGNGNGRH